MVMLVVGGGGATIILGGKVYPEETLKDQYAHVAHDHLIDDVGAQIAPAEKGYVPPALEEVRSAIKAQLDRTKKYGHLFK